ncbi:hypothetical protein [Motilimonas cestriensis]
MPPSCTPILITDAGYRNTWFRQVEALGWYWLGRLRGEVGVKLAKQGWLSNKSFFTKGIHSLSTSDLLSSQRRILLHASFICTKGLIRNAKVRGIAEQVKSILLNTYINVLRKSHGCLPPTFPRHVYCKTTR